MRVVVALEHRFERTPDGAVWSRGWVDASFWHRYLEVFDEVVVLARVREVRRQDAAARRADGPRVTFAALPHYLGPWQYLRRRGALTRQIAAAFTREDAVVLRVPGAVASLVEKRLRARGHPFGVEVVGDPLEVFAGGGVRTRLNPLLRVWVPRTLRRQCRYAAAVSYVTRRTLQERYPAADSAFTTWYSTLDLGDDAFAARSREVSATSPVRLLLAGSLEQLYKGPDILLRAVRICRERGAPLQVRIVGDGRERRALEQMASALSVTDCVQFAGRVPAGDTVRAEMDAADLFVLPSRTEGLPRVLIEAMARAAPAIGSKVGGIPELLEPEEMFPPGDPLALAQKILEVMGDAPRLAAMSARNLRKARDYHLRNLQPRRRAFYEAVKAATGGHG